VKVIEYANQEYPDFGEFAIDGRDPNIILLSKQCERGSPAWCLGATAQKAYNATLAKPLRAKGITWQLERDNDQNLTGGTIGLTYGEWRYTRPMTVFEAQMADKFDKEGRLPRRAVTVNLDTSDDKWTRGPKGVGGGRKHPGNQNGAGNKTRKARRAEDLRQWFDMMTGKGV
jgi:hypothetical protein